MAYLTDIQGNNADLQSILDAVNALPEAGSGEINLQSKDAFPSTEGQLITADEGYDGLSDVMFHPMKLQSKNVTPSSRGEIVSADSDYDGLLNAIVEGDPNLRAQNIVKGKSIFGVEGSYEPNLGEFYASAESTDITYEAADYGHDGFSKFTIQTDPNLVPENIVAGVEIFGVAGTAEVGDGGGGSGSDLPLYAVQHSFYDGVVFVNGILVNPDEIRYVPSEGLDTVVVNSIGGEIVTEIQYQYEIWEDGEDWGDSGSRIPIFDTEWELYVAPLGQIFGGEVTTLTIVTGDGGYE